MSDNDIRKMLIEQGFLMCSVSGTPKLLYGEYLDINGYRKRELTIDDLL